MAWTKNVAAKIARTNNEDLRGTFYYSDSSANPPSAVRFSLTISNQSGEKEIADILVSDALTAGERTTLGALLVKLRDIALTQAGYTDI